MTASPVVDLPVAHICQTFLMITWFYVIDNLASFPGSPSFCAIIQRMTFDPPEGKAEGEPGRFCHMTSVMLRHPYIRYRRGRTGLLFHGYSSATWDLAGSLAVVRRVNGGQRKGFLFPSIHNRSLQYTSTET